MVDLSGSSGASRASPKVGKLEREGHLGIEGQAGDRKTLWISATRHTQQRRAKIVSGDGVSDDV